MEQYRSHVLVCAGGGCVSSGCKAVRDALILGVAKHGLEKEIKVLETGCIGSCDLGPMIVVYPEGIAYKKLKAEDVPLIVEEHLLKGRPVKKWMMGEAEKVTNFKDINFFGFQEKNVLRNCGFIDPMSIEEYIARDGYQAIAKALTSLTPEQTIEEVKASGLRGRGGGGFPTGVKWQLTAQTRSDVKYVVCNADEGDPGAFMDRSLLEGDPHAVIEGMMIAGYAIGASQGFVYVRAEYPLAIERLEHAIEQAKNVGLLGENILGTSFSFDLEIRMGAGAFVCGEETALFASIEGRRGIPSSKPPYPAVAGLWGKPTVINNVETFANVPLVVDRGAAWFSSIGTEKSKGTKIFALAGKINNTGLVEVPMGTTLRQIIYDIGGGIPKGRAFKAVQCGGPSGGCIPDQFIDVPIDYDSLQKLGAMMGSGGLIVMDETTCMVDLARFFLDFIQDESCGKCPPCRIGTKVMLEILERITRGEGVPGDIEQLQSLGEKIKATALCGLGQSAPNPVLSTIKYFREEYEDHIDHKFCKTGTCKKLSAYEVNENLCKGCGLCIKSCPVSAIRGERKQPHSIEADQCIKCGSCIEACPFKAIVVAPPKKQEKIEV
ncbi:MAG TPA: NADH-quinone oxidoreductase subunit NuoF [Chroococcales cyanobacterium]|jgi:NADP-reducing hydrogenase subunit HndC